MKFYAPLLLVFMFLLGLSSCYQEPDFTMEPRLIGFDGNGLGIRFVDVPNTIADSLIIRVKFEDGDGNLGVQDDEPDPFLREEYAFPRDDAGNYIYYDSRVDGEYDCTQFSYFNTVGRDTIRDTIRVIRNPYFYNFEVELYVKEDGVFEEYNLLEEDCRAPLGGRFFPLKDDFSNTKPLEGIIEHRFVSPGLVSKFRNDTLKISVRIRDRALNESNVVESCPFVLVGDRSIFVEPDCQN